MDKFGHFFELIAAINSVYIVSDAFLENLLKKINSEFQTLKTKCSGLYSYQADSVLKLSQEAKKVEGNIEAEKTSERLSNTAKEIDEEINELKKEIEESFEDKNMYRNFNYWCLFGCLYCILVLLLNGTEVDYKTTYIAEPFLLLNIISPIAILWIIKKKTSKWGKKYFCASYNKVLLLFLACLSLVIAVYFYEKYYNTHIFDRSLRYITIITSVILPVAHFLFYFIKSTLFSRNKAASCQNKLIHLEVLSQHFANEVEVSYKVVNDFIKH